MYATFQKFALGAAMSILIATANGGQAVEVWVLLTEPPVSSGTSHELVMKQQQDVLAGLKALGAVELGRVSVARNAIAVSIDASKLPEVKQLSGVRSVTPVRDVRRDPPTPPTR